MPKTGKEWKDADEKKLVPKIRFIQLLSCKIGMVVDQNSILLWSGLHSMPNQGLCATLVESKIVLGLNFGQYLYEGDGGSKRVTFNGKLRCLCYSCRTLCLHIHDWFLRG